MTKPAFKKSFDRLLRFFAAIKTISKQNCRVANAKCIWNSGNLLLATILILLLIIENQ